MLYHCQSNESFPHQKTQKLDKVDNDVLIILKVINEFDVVLETIRDGVVASATHPKK